MSDPYDFRRSTGMQLRDENLMYDDFYVVPPLDVWQVRY